jgi:NADH dehydrogenase [ubiquinone] 1 alpha subcomplex assembly factor 7
VAPSLAQRLRERIRRDGPLPFRAWMQASLYDPEGGFYTGGAHPAGLARGTHFATSPTLHPFFAHCVARELAEAWKGAGRPAAWEVVEFGAGTGALARDAMWELRRLGVPARWTAVDVRPGPEIKGVRWLSKAPPAFDAAVANEFLDALPFDLAEWRDGAWRLVGVGLGDDGESFDWHLLGPVPHSVSLTLPPGEEGARRVLWPDNRPWVAGLRAAGARIALVVDYGEAAPARDVRAFRGHDFTDPLGEPGTVDLTADVDFAELAAQANAEGFTLALETQERFLIRHGVFDAINRIDRTTREGTSSYLRLRQLLLPTGFGVAFKVATLTRPPES